MSDKSEDAREAVETYEAAKVFFEEVMEEVKEQLGEELWDTFLEARTELSSSCDAARKAVKAAGTTFGNFAFTQSKKNVWDVPKLVTLAKKREELDDLIEAGLDGFSFSAAQAEANLTKESYDIYREEGWKQVPGNKIIRGPKPDDDPLS